MPCARSQRDVRCVSPCQCRLIAIKCARHDNIFVRCRGPATLEASRPTVYSHPFSYHRAQSLGEATKLLHQLGEESRVIAGGQSLIPLMKMRLARPTALIAINFIKALNEFKKQNGE